MASLSSSSSSSSSSSLSTLLFINLPPKTFVGIDLLSFQSSPNFHGITNVPPGFHFIYASTDVSLAIRHGRWLKIPFKGGDSPATAHVFKWAGTDECLQLLPANSSEVHAVTNVLPTLRDRGLVVEYQALEDATADAAAQRQQGSDDNDNDDKTGTPSDWRFLVSHVDDKVLTRILSTDWALTSVSSAPQDTEDIPGLSRLEASSVLSSETKLSFVPVNLKQTWPADAIGRDRTDGARDRSWYLGHLIDSLVPEGHNREEGARTLLGELQFCFVMVLVLANYSCLEQWKRILSVICTCQTALAEVEPFFVEVIKLLTLQMAHVDDVDGGLFDLRDGDSSNSSSWLRQLIRKFRDNVEEQQQQQQQQQQHQQIQHTAVPGPLWKQLDSFEAFMKNDYNWESGRNWLRRGMVELEDGDKVELSMDGADEDDETGEYAPVIVET